MPVSSVRIISSSTQSASDTESSKWAEVWRSVVPFALVFLAACTLFFINLGNFPLFNPDEALYAEPAREMLEIGDYITTYLNYVVRFTKPPVAIWGQALSILAFGCNEFAVRFFGAAAGALLVAATYCFAEKFAGRRAAIASSMMLCTAPLFIGTAREAITDMPLSFFSASSMFLFYTSLQTQSKRMLWLAYALTGLAVMTKGPVGLVLPVAILGVFHFLRQDIKSALRFYSPLVGLSIVGIIAVPWFAVEIWITKGAYFNEFIMGENVQRFTSVVDSHKGGWWYHIAAVMGGFFPWSIFIPQSLLGAIPWQKLRQFWKDSGPLSILRAFQNMSPTDNLSLFCICWTVVTVGFFSVSVSKLLPYTLPAFPAIALLIALEFERIIESQLARRAVIPAFILFAIFAGTSVILPHAVMKLRDAPETLVEMGSSFASYEVIFTMLCVALLSRRFFRAGFFLFLLPTFMGILFFGGRILTVLSQTWEEPLPAMARYAGSSDLPILVFDMRKPSMPFYTGRKVIQPGSREALIAFLKSPEGAKGAYILTKSKQNDFFRAQEGCKLQYSQGKFVLVRYVPNSPES